MKQRPLSQAAEAGQISHDIELTKELNHLITESRDVLKGGRRLATGNNRKDTEEVADQLYRTGREEGGGLDAAENGIIVAILVDRFDSFRHTIALVTDGGCNAELEVIEKERSDIIKLIRQFDLHQAMVRIDATTAGETLNGVLSNHQLEKIKAELKKYFDSTALQPISEE